MKQVISDRKQYLSRISCQKQNESATLFYLLLTCEHRQSSLNGTKRVKINSNETQNSLILKKNQRFPFEIWLRRSGTWGVGEHHAPRWKLHVKKRSVLFCFSAVHGHNVDLHSNMAFFSIFLPGFLNVPVAVYIVER